MDASPDALQAGGAQARNLQESISEHLRSLIGQHGVPILTEYVWHMVVNPQFNSPMIRNELREFLGDRTDDFVHWLSEHVIAQLPEPQIETPELKIEDAELVEVNDNDESDARRVALRERDDSPHRRVVVESRSRQYAEPYDRRGRPDVAPVNLIPAPQPIIKLKKRCIKYPSCPFGDQCRFIHPREAVGSHFHHTRSVRIGLVVPTERSASTSTLKSPASSARLASTGAATTHILLGGHRRLLCPKHQASAPQDFSKIEC